MSPPSIGDSLDPKRERSRVAQREYRKRHASKFNTLKDENQRLRNALKRVEKLARKRAGKDQELETALSEARETAGSDDNSDENGQPASSSSSGASDPITEGTTDITGLLSSDIHLHTQAQALSQDITQRLSMTQQLWTDTDHLARIFEAPSDARRYLGDGLYTFAGTLYWACTRNTVSLWETYKLNMLGRPGPPDMNPMDRLFNHTKHLTDRRFMLSLALARLEYKQKGFIEQPHAGTEIAYKSVLPELRKKMEQELADKGQGMEWWKTPREVENHLMKYLEPSEVDELQALIEGRSSAAVLTKYSPLVEMMINEFVCFPDGPRWNLLYVAMAVGSWRSDHPKPSEMSIGV